MADFRNSAGLCPRDKEMVCIDTYRILDSCRDKDCYEDVRVYVTCSGQEILDRTTAVRAKKSNVVWSCINIDNVPFNRGFYQLFIKIYVKLCFEACIGPGNIQEFEGIAVVEKKVILFGGEGNVHVFKSELNSGSFCSHCQSTPSSVLPIAVVETVDPIVLGTKVIEPGAVCRCCSCCTIDEIPDCVCSHLSCDLSDDNRANKLLVSLGFFSVVRIERPAQYLVSAVEYAVPEKECTAPNLEDPCSLFRQMSFPTAEFSASGIPGSQICCENEKKCGC